MNVSTQALLFATGIGLSLILATVSYIGGRRSTPEFLQFMTTPRRAQEVRRYTPKSVFGASFVLMAVLGSYLALVSADIFDANEPTTMWPVQILEIIIASAVGIGCAVGIMWLFTSLGMAKTEAGPVLMRRSVSAFVIALAVILLAFILRAVALGIIL